MVHVPQYLFEENPNYRYEYFADTRNAKQQTSENLQLIYDCVQSTTKLQCQGGLITLLSFGFYPGVDRDGEAPIALSKICRFENQSEWSICCARSISTLFICYQSGATYDVSLPFDVQKLLPIPRGLIFQASYDHETTSLSEESFSSLFTLSHPLEDVRPVDEVVDGGKLKPIHSSEKLLFSCTDFRNKIPSKSSIFVTFNTIKFFFSLWTLQPMCEAPLRQEIESNNSFSFQKNPKNKSSVSDTRSFKYAQSAMDVHITYKDESDVEKRSKKYENMRDSNSLSSSFLTNETKKSMQQTSLFLGGASTNVTSFDVNIRDDLQTLRPDYTACRIHSFTSVTIKSAELQQALNYTSIFCLSDFQDRSIDALQKETYETFLLCILDPFSSTLRVFNVGKKSVVDDFKLFDVQSAVSLCNASCSNSLADLPSRRMVVLFHSKEIYLYVGHSKICRIDPPLEPTYVFNRIRSSLRDAATLDTECGKSFRLDFSLKSSSQRVSFVLSTLERLNPSCAILSASLSVDVRRCTRFNASISTSDDPDWTSFVSLLSALSCSRLSHQSEAFGKALFGNSISRNALESRIMLRCLDLIDSNHVPMPIDCTWPSSLKPTTSQELFDKNTAVLLCVLHMVSQDFIVSQLRESLVPSLCTTALELANRIKECSRNVHEISLAHSYILHSNLCCFSSKTADCNVANTNDDIPCIYRYVHNLLSGKKINSWGWNIGSGTPIKVLGSGIAAKVFKFYSIVSRETDWNKRCESLLLSMVEEHFSKDDLVQMQLGFSMLLLDALNFCAQNPSSGWPDEAYLLIGREDFGMMNAMIRGMKKEKEFDFPSRVAFYTAGDADNLQSNDGLDDINSNSLLRFPNDCRVDEVCRILRSSKAQRISVERPPELTDLDYVNRQQQVLYLAVRRKVAACIGRGALTYGSVASSSLQDPLPIPIPQLNLSCKLHPSNATLKLDTNTSEIPSDWLEWPEFHNGVSAGLRLLPSDRRTPVMTRNWVLYARKTEAANQAKDGFLLGLGLQGHLKNLTPHDIARLLEQKSDKSQSLFTTVGCLLGLAADRQGTGNRVVHRALRWHMLSQWPSTEDIGSLCDDTVQTAAIFGLGLLHQSTGNRLVTELLLEELSCISQQDKVKNRQSYSLAAGLALGCVNLARGSDPGLSDLHLEERLLNFSFGGRVELTGSPSLAKMQNRTHLNGSQGGASKLSTGKFINTDVTAAGAILALGLVHLGTNDLIHAERLPLPETHFALDYIRPDLLMLLVISRALIMWDSVEASIEWVNKQVPKVVAEEYERMGNALPEGLRGIVDRQSIKQAHAYLLAGSCFALGLRYAGTQDVAAKDICIKQLKILKHYRDGTGGLSLAARRPEKSDVETCICSTALSLSMIMAGSGDIDCFRLLRELRWRSDAAIPYGTHVAIAQAMGILFLHGGKATLKRDPQSIAALLASFFPRYPTNTSDNRYHLQALRHFYVLAVERRCIEAVDVCSGLAVPVRLLILPNEGDGEGVVLETPCALPELDSIAEIRLLDEGDYWPMRLAVGSNPAAKRYLLESLRVYVKRTENSRVSSDVNEFESEATIFHRYVVGNDGLDNHRGKERHASLLDDLLLAVDYAGRNRHRRVLERVGYPMRPTSMSSRDIMCRLEVRDMIARLRKSSVGMHQKGAVVWNIRLLLQSYQRGEGSHCSVRLRKIRDFFDAVRVESESILDASDERLRHLYFSGCSRKGRRTAEHALTTLFRRGTVEEIAALMEKVHAGLK